MRRGAQKRWRFRLVDGSVVEVEAEPTSGFNLSTNQRWEGVHVKARPFLRRKWDRANLIDGTIEATEAIEEVAARIVGLDRKLRRA